jgi:hypothetical protein
MCKSIFNYSLLLLVSSSSNIFITLLHENVAGAGAGIG